MWSLLLAYVLAADISMDVKVDIVCYCDPWNTQACADVERSWGMPQVAGLLGKFLWAGPSNASTVLKSASSLAISVFVMDHMTGSDNDIFDLNSLEDYHGIGFTSVQGRSSSTANWGDKLKQLSRSQAKAIAKIKAKAESGAYANATDVSIAITDALRRKYEKYSSAFDGASTPVEPPGASGSISAYGTGCHVTSSGDVYSKVLALSFLNGLFTLHSEIHVPFMWATTFGDEYFTSARIVNSEYINVDYLLTNADCIKRDDFKKIRYKDIGIISYRVKAINFDSTKWLVEYEQYSGVTYSAVLTYSEVAGGFSVLAQTDQDLEVRFTVSSEGGTVEVKGLNLSLQASIGSSSPMLYVPGFSQPKLSVTFDEDWDNIVSNTPEIILETSNPNLIEVKGQPSKVSIRKTSISDRPGLKPPEDGPNVALIVGVVIAVLVVVGIIVAVVVVIVIKKKKEKVHPEEPDERKVTPEPGVSQEQQVQQPPPSQPSQQPPPSQPSQQPPPSQPYQQPPPQYQYQQPPPQWQYQQPPPQWQYQPAPPQWQYQQPPEESGKHKHKDKHKHKKDKHKKDKHNTNV